MPVINKDDFSAFDEALKKAPAQKEVNTSDDEFAAFDQALKKKVDGQDLKDGGQEPKTSGTPLTPSQSPSSLQEGEEKPSWQTSALNPAYAAQQAQLRTEEPIPKQKDWKDIVLDKSSFNKPIPSDATYVSRPVTGEKIEQVTKSRANMQTAIDNTTERALKAKGLSVPKNSPVYIKQRKKIEEAVKNNDAVYTVDPTTKQPALSQTTGFFESIKNSFISAVNDEDESDEFVNNMDTQQRVDYANKKIEEAYAITKEGYVGKTPSAFVGEAGQTIGGAIPFVTKMTAGAVAGAGLIAAAPETGGATLAGLPAVLSFAFTNKDAVNQGGKNEVIRRYNILKQQKPGVSDFDLMREAESGLTSGEITGGLTNLVFTAIGAKPAQAIPVIEKSLANTLKNTAHGTIKAGVELGTISAGGTAAQEIEAGLEDKRFKKSASEIIDDTVKSFGGGLTTGILLHTATQAVLGSVNLPGQLRSAVKYSLSKESPVELQAILSNNEQLGNIPPGTTEAVMADLNSYNKSLEKTSQDLTPETQASVAGLIQKRDNLMSEMSSKDATQIDPYLQQIDAINNQIKGITETNDPFAYEVNDVTGQPLNGEISEAPLQKGIEGEQIIPEQKTKAYDKENIPGVSGEIGVGEKPIPAEPIKGAGAEEVSTGGNVQALGAEGEGEGVGKKVGEVTAEEADIEKRKEEAKKGIVFMGGATPLAKDIDGNTGAYKAFAFDENGKNKFRELWGIEGATKQEVIDKINAFYDAELKALKEKQQAELPQQKGVGEVKTELPKPTLEEGATTELPPQVKGALPRQMIFKEGEWKEKVGSQITGVSEKVQEQAQAAWESKAAEAEVPEQKTKPYDTENIPGLPSKVGVGEKPVTTEPIKGAGAEETGAGRVLQAPGAEGEGEGIEQKEVIKKMKPFTDKMVEIEREFKNNGYEIDTDYDNEIQVLDKNGEQVEPDELPDNLKKLAADYEKATMKLGDFDASAREKALAESRKVIDTEAEISQQKGEGVSVGEVPKSSIEIKKALEENNLNDISKKYEGAKYGDCIPATNDAAEKLLNDGNKDFKVYEGYVLTKSKDGAYNDIVNHTWIQLNDGTIIDASVDQFNDRGGVIKYYDENAKGWRDEVPPKKVWTAEEYKKLLDKEKQPLELPKKESVSTAELPQQKGEGVGGIEATAKALEDKIKEKYGEEYKGYPAELNLANGQLEKVPFVEDNIMPHIKDVFKEQSNNLEGYIHGENSDWNGANHIVVHKFEKAGDIFRELSIKKNSFVDNGYLNKNIRILQEYINGFDQGDSVKGEYDALRNKNKEKLAEFRKGWENQAVMTEAQQHAKDLVLSLIDNNLKDAQKELDYFKDIIKSDKVAEANKYDIAKIYNETLKVPEQKRTEQQNQLISSVNKLLGVSELPQQKGEGVNVGEVEATIKALEGKDISKLSKLIGIEPSEKISDSEDFETATKAILTAPNKGIANMMLGKETEVSKKQDVHTHTYQKTGKTLNWDLSVYENGKGQKRYVLYERKYPEQIDAAALIDKDGKVLQITTSKDFRKIGLSQTLLKEIKSDIGQIVPSEPISKAGKKALDNFSKSQISEAYHKAKADGSNPELVKAVEDLIGKQAELPQQKGVGEVKTEIPETSIEEANKKLEELGNRQVEIKGKGTWRQEFNKEKDAFRKSAILRAVAEGSKNIEELNDIKNVAIGMPEEGNIINEVDNKLKSLGVEPQFPEQLKKEKEYEGIQNKEDKRKAEVVKSEPTAATTIDKERLEQSARNANKREEAKTNLIKLRDEGILVTADKSIIAKAKKAMGMKAKPVPMTDAEINAQMSMLDAMSNVWKETTGQDNFYDTFISDIKKGDLKAVKDKGGVLFQDESVPTRPISRVTLSVFDAPQFEKMKGQMVAPQSISDFIKGKGKQIEKDIINNVLAFDKYKGQKRISFDDFKNDVEIQVMKLEKIKSNSYASYGMDNLGSGYGDAKTIIFNAPVDHGETGHFSGDFTTMGIDGKNWELRQIPNTEVWAAVDKDMPDNTSQAEIQKYVGTAGNKGEVENWINQRNANSSTGNVNKGLFGHIRAWFDKRNKVFHLAELQSDVYQKSKAADLFAESVPSAEVDEYMNKEVWSKLGDERSNAIIEERGYKVKQVKDEWIILDKNDRVLAERSIYRTEPGFEEGQYDRNEAINNALNNEANQGFTYDRIESEDFAEIKRRIYKLESLLDNVKSNREFDAINKEIESLNKKLYKYQVYSNIHYKTDALEKFDTSEDAVNYINQLGAEIVKIKEFKTQIQDYFHNKTGDLLVKKQEYIDRRAKEIKEAKGENMLEKQFIASQKVHEMRLFREAMKHAAEEGADVVRFPSPYTLAVIEGYVDHTGEGNAPYEIIRGDSDRLEQGDIIEYGGTELMVIDSDRSSITVAPRDEVSVFRISDYVGEEASNRYSEIEYEASKHFENLDNITKEEIESYSPDEWMGNVAKELLEEKIADVEEGETIRWGNIENNLTDYIYDTCNEMDVNDLISWGGDIYTDGDTAYVAESSRSVESFNQPDGYEAESTEDNFEDNLSRDQQTVVDKYKEMGQMIKKTRPDAISIRDGNGMEWIETKITDADRNNPIIAFQNEGGKIKGAVDFMNDNKATFHIFDGADISTLAHEITGHLGRRFLEKLAETNEQFSKDYDAVKKWANVKDNQWTTKAEEKFARGFERYLREGKAPTKALEAVFANLKEWLVNIYKNIKGSSIDVKLTQEVKDVFGRLLGGEVKAEKPKMEEKVTPEIPEPKAKLEVEVEKPEVIEEEVKPVEERKTGVKKAITTPLREALGLPAVELPKMGKDIEELQQAKQRIDSGETNPVSMVDDILKSDRGYKDEKEVFDMQYYAHQLDAKDRELSKEMSEADNDIDKAEVANKKQLLSDEIDRQTEAARKAGNKWGKIGYSMQPVIDEGFNISRERNLIKEAYAGEIPQQVKEKIDAITKERDEAIAQKAKIEKDLIDLKAKKEIAQKEKEVQAEQKGKVKKTKEDFVKERKTIIDKIKKKWKDSKGGGTMYSLAVPIPIEKIKQLAAISPEVGELIKSHVEEGISKLDDIVSNVHDLLKDQIDGLTKKDVLDLIAGKYVISKERSEAAKKVAEIRAEAKKLLKENATPNEKIQAEIDRLNKKADNIEAKLREGVVIKEKESELNPYNNSEWIKADQRVSNAEKKMRDLKREAFESQKNWYQKSLMWAGRGVRLAILSGYKVLGKLTSAATIGAAAKRIPEQTIGSIYNKVFSSIAKKAPIEGSSMGLNSELKWYKEFFNPKKFAKNSWDILKTGTTHLNRKMGKSEYEHIPVLYLPTDLHQIIKDPVKRATFESSFDNAMRWAAKEGLDVTDPLIVQSIENAAFKRANYEIFQESNALTRKFTAWKNEMEQKGNLGATGKFVADFFIPISSVPTNIARRVGITSPFGLLKANVDVINAYRKGIENLKPEEADMVMRQLKQGTLGTALWMIGWFGFASFGGLYTKFNPNKQRDDEDLASDKMEVGGVEIPKPTQHALPLEVIQSAATARRLWNKYNEDEELSTFEAIAKAGLGSIGAVAEQIPVIETPVHMIMATQEPYEAKKLGEDIKGRFQPQILKETGVIKKEDKIKKAYTEEELNSPIFKSLSESGIEIPKLGTRLSYTIDIDDAHPKGIMTPDEFKKFSELVVKYSHDYTNENLSDPSTISSIKRLNELIKKQSRDPKIESEITELKREIKSILSSAHRNAIDMAKYELNLFTK